MIEHDSFLFLAAKDLSTALGRPRPPSSRRTSRVAPCARRTRPGTGGTTRRWSDRSPRCRSPRVRAAVVRTAAGRRRSSSLTLLVAAALLIVGLLALVAFAGSPVRRPSWISTGVGSSRRMTASSRPSQSAVPARLASWSSLTCPEPAVVATSRAALAAEPLVRRTRSAASSRGFNARTAPTSCRFRSAIPTTRDQVCSGTRTG